MGIGEFIGCFIGIGIYMHIAIFASVLIVSKLWGDKGKGEQWDKFGPKNLLQIMVMVIIILPAVIILQ